MSNENSAAKQPLSFMPVVVLVTICVVAGILLGLVHQVTQPVAAPSPRSARSTYAALVPEAASFEELDCSTSRAAPRPSRPRTPPATPLATSSWPSPRATAARCPSRSPSTPTAP